MMGLRRRLPKAPSPLEMLDDRIVPSAVGVAPIQNAALVQHPPAPHAIQAMVLHSARSHHHHHKAHAAHPVSRVTVIPTPVPSGGSFTTLTPGAQTFDPADGPLAKAGNDLSTIYREFQQQGGSATFTSSLAGRVQIQGTNVGVDVHMAGGDFGTFVTAMSGLGMQVKATDAAHGIVEGFLPISQLPAAAQNPQTLSLSPISIPVHGAASLN